jgi:diguanylate cyclase (GGDEF)-like protein
MSRWMWRGAVAAGGVILTGLLVMPPGPGRQLLWLGLSLIALAATLVGPRLHPPTRRHQGWLLAVAMGGFAITNAISAIAWDWPADHVAHLASSLLFPVSYVLIGVAMLRLVAARTPDGDPDGSIDGFLVMIATGAVLYDLITAPGVAGSTDVVERTVFAALPLVQAPVIAAAVRLLITGSHRQPAAWCFLVAATGGLVGNVLFVLGIGDPWLLGAWFAAYLLVTIATLHPSYAELSAPAPVADARLSFGRLAVIGTALLALPAVMLLGQGGSLASAVPAIAAAVCVVLVLWRIARLLRERERVSAELSHRAEREAALSALGHAAMTDIGPEAFVAEVTATVATVLAARCEVVAHRAVPGDGPQEVGELVHARLGAGEENLVVAFPPGTDPSPEDERFVRTVADLTAAALRRWGAEQQLRHQSMHDTLTGLPNRALVLDRLQVAFDRAVRPRSPVSVLFLDLDGFKAVNDTLGHAAGDDLLIGVAVRLRAAVRPGDTVGRLAGDEFVVLCDGGSPADAARLAERLAEVLREPYVLEHGEVEVTASIGMGVAEPDTDPERLLQQADAAMYRAKRQGGGMVARIDELPVGTDTVGAGSPVAHRRGAEVAGA